MTHAHSNAQRQSSRLIAWPGAVLALCLATVAAQAADGPAPAARPALTVTLTAPERSDWPTLLAANGSIAAWQEAVIGAEAAGLRLVDLRAQVGDRVRRGQVLALLQSDTLGADLAVARAGLAEAEASLTEAQGNADRARALQPTGVISAQQTQQLLTAEATAKARVVSAKARVDAAEVRLSQTRILAPDDGVISARTATLGSVSQAGQELFRLIRQGRLEWRAEVPASELMRLKAGQPVRVTPAGGAPVAGRLRLVGPVVDAATRNALVYVDLPQPAEARPGMFARGEFDLGPAAALSLPVSAVQLREGFAYVQKVDAQQRIRQHKVTVGRRVGERVEVLAGLQPQDRVVNSGGGFLGEGDLVRVVQPAAVPAAAPASTTAPKR
ncbi:MAG: efflux RND transporter periplasmic adaptor subunit [Burkholderiales bacterium]